MRQSFSLNQPPPPHQYGCIRPTASPVAVFHPPLVLFRWSHLPPPRVPLSTGFPSNISSTQLRPSPVPLQPDWFQTGLEFSSCLSSQQQLCRQRQARGASEQLGGQRRGPASRIPPQICGLQGQRGQLGSRAQTSHLVYDPVRCGPVSPTVSDGSSSPSKEALEVLNLQTPQGAHR